jgi:hypothetical protein
MQSALLCLPGIGLAAVSALFVAMIIFQRRELRLRRLHNATLEFAGRLSFYECNAFLQVAQTGDDAELARRWPTWPEFRDASMRGDYLWGDA